MQRREIATALIASTAGATLLSREAGAQTCTPPCYPRTAAETAAGVTPVDTSSFPNPWLWVRREGCLLDGVTDDTAAFNRCISVAAGVNIAFVIDGPCFLNSTIQIPQNVQLVFVGSGLLKAGNSHQITLGQTPQAGLWKIFDVSASNSAVLMPVSRSTEVWAEWWGAIGDGFVFGNDVPINAALKSISNGGGGTGGTVRLGAGTFLTSDVINVFDYTSIRGLNDWTKIKANPGSWSGSAVMITAENGTSPMFDSRLEYMILDASNIDAIQVVVRSDAWQQRCGIYFCELDNFNHYGFFHAHGYGGAAVLEMVSTDFNPNDIDGAVGAYFTSDASVGWTKLNIRNCAFASTGSGANGCAGLWVDGRFVCTVEGVDFEQLEYGIMLGNGAVLTGAGLSGGGQTPANLNNAIIRCLGTWTGPSAGNVNVIGCQIGGWRRMLSDQNRPYACGALNPYDGQVRWPPNLAYPVGCCIVTGGGTPVLGDTTSQGVCSKLDGATIVHSATGVQTLTFSTTMDTSGAIFAMATSLDAGVTQIAVKPTGATTVQIVTKSPAGAAADASAFMLQIFHAQ